MMATKHLAQIRRGSLGWLKYKEWLRNLPSPLTSPTTTNPIPDPSPSPDPSPNPSQSTPVDQSDAFPGVVGFHPTEVYVEAGVPTPITMQLIWNLPQLLTTYSRHPGRRSVP